MNKILVCPLTCNIFNDTRKKSIEETWLKDVQNYLWLTNEESENCAKLSEAADYYSATVRHVNSFSYIYNMEKEYDWYFFCDDDTFVNYKNLDNFVSSLDKEQYKAYGMILDSQKDPGNPIWRQISKNYKFFSGGAGFIFNRVSLEKVMRMGKCIIRDGILNGDVMLGMAMVESDIELIDIDLFRSAKPKDYHHSETEIKNMITYHRIIGQEMYDLYSIIK